MTFLRFLPMPGILLSGVLAGAVVPVFGKDKVEIKVLCFPRMEEKSTIDLMIGKRKVIEIPLQGHEFTLPRKVTRQAKWRFGKSNVNSKGKFTFDTWATATPLAADKQLLVFVRRGPDNRDGFEVIPINPATINGSSYLFLNLTPSAVAGVVGGRKFRLTSGRSIVIKPQPDRGENLCFTSLRYYRDKNWRPFFSSNWRLRKKCRCLIFIYQPNGQKTPRIHSVIDPL